MTVIKITDTTFRDAHQSLMATRLRTEDMTPIANLMDSIGFHSMEVWGGATFDTSTRFLFEDPWDRLRQFKKLIPNTPLQMLLRGQSLVGYRNYADDFVDAFISRSAETGIDIFRVFDALNDERNLARSASAVKNTGKHLQMTICYSVTGQGKLGGPIYNLEYYLDKAKIYNDLGADSICIKDMAGLLSPYDSYELISALKNVMDIPVQLHTHYTSGMASMSCLKAIEAGVDVIDTCMSPLALRTSQPAIEPLLVSLSDTEYDLGLDLNKLLEVNEYLESMLVKYKPDLEPTRSAVIDAQVMSHQIPGGMISNLTSQLKDMGELARLPEVLKEIPETRRDLGYPPLVTPISQMVGSQAVSNVLTGKYVVVSDELKDYVSGLYGLPPSSIDPEIIKLILKDNQGTRVKTTGRPADTLKPELDNARNAIKNISNEIDDVLTYGLYPVTGMRFLRIKHGIDPVPIDSKVKTKQNEVEETDNVDHKILEMGDSPPSKSNKLRTFNVHIGNQYFKVEVDPAELNTPNKDPEESINSNDTSVKAPMPGIIINYLVEIGQRVEIGQPLVVLEAMKMENSIPSPISGEVIKLTKSIGDKVKKSDELVLISSN